LAWLPIVGLAAIVGLTVAGGFNGGSSLRREARTVQKPTKIENPPGEARLATAFHEAPTTSTPAVYRPTLEPVARATAPGAGAEREGSIAASLIPSTALPPSAPKLARQNAIESPGTKPVAVPERAVGTAPPPPSRQPATAIATNPPPVQIAALTPLENTPAPGASDLALPAITPVSRPAAWRVYAATFDRDDKRPRIALVVAGAGDGMAGAIDNLPAGVTLALDPYDRRLPERIALARASGHEVLLALSMPPIGHGNRDVGPTAILSSLDPKENLARLEWALDRARGFAGVLDIIGNRPASETDPIVATLARHGLMLVSGSPLRGEPATLPLATGDAMLMPNLSRRDLDQKLAALEDKAKSEGHALAIGVVTPALLHRLAAWLATLPDKSIALAPATALLAAGRDTGIARE
jgi:hypothetical protein